MPASGHGRLLRFGAAEVGLAAAGVPRPGARRCSGGAGHGLRRLRQRSSGGDRESSALFSPFSSEGGFHGVPLKSATPRMCLVSHVRLKDAFVAVFEGTLLLVVSERRFPGDKPIWPFKQSPKYQLIDGIQLLVKQVVFGCILPGTLSKLLSFEGSE